jgi:hypothetical protein
MEYGVDGDDTAVIVKIKIIIIRVTINIYVNYAVILECSNHLLLLRSSRTMFVCVHRNISEQARKRKDYTVPCGKGTPH